MLDLSIKVKSYFVIILMIGCFALLYPKIIHPMILHLFGIRIGDVNQNDFVHPRDRHMKINAEPARPAYSGHPGRLNTEKQPQGSRGVIMTMVLPVYAIGIIFYLIYTLVKVFSGSKNNLKREKRDSILKNYYQDFHYDPSAGNFKMNYNDSNENSYRFRPTDDIYDCSKTLPHDLEDLLQKVDDRNISEEEMRQLRIRLEQTEAQLTRILSAMEQLDVNSKLEQENDDNNESPDPVLVEKFQDNFVDCKEELDTELIQRKPVQS